ncbi:HalOD1 output domain-containing protein [Halostella pelagica]|uniref:HalOD1 output domain-containing protein n=1 Tax=Halostella pelagica TaxID=2583824 RepID=UPI001081591C|nr:HalOD1 output domain-containing protein [Halostella pelagica]
MSGNLSNIPSDSTDRKRGGVGTTHRYDADEAEPPSVAVSRALAGARGESPCSSTPQLYEYVDPDALDSLFVEWGSADSATTVDMEIGRYTVVVRGRGEVVVRVTGP